MKNQWTWILVLALGTLASDARSQVVAFQDDFNHDTVGQLPLRDPPLAPVDDVLIAMQGAGDFKVRDAVGDLTDQPLQMTQGAQVSSQYVQCKLSPDLRSCQNYVISWRSLMIAPSVFFVSGAARGPRGELMASISWRGDKVVFNAGGANETDMSVGWVPNVSQLFDLSLDMVNHTVSLSVDGVPLPEIQDQSFRQSANDLVSWIVSFGGIGTQTIVLDDLLITATGCGGVAIEEPNWGAVKARW
jgi:hypothetical protein